MLQEFFLTYQFDHPFPRDVSRGLAALSDSIFLDLMALQYLKKIQELKKWIFRNYLNLYKQNISIINHLFLRKEPKIGRFSFAVSIISFSL